MILGLKQICVLVSILMASAVASFAQDAKTLAKTLPVPDERYKLEWSDLHLKLFDYTVAVTWRGWPASASSVARRRLKRFIKQTPLAWRLAGHLRAAIGSLSHSRAS